MSRGLAYSCQNTSRNKCCVNSNTKTLIVLERLDYSGGIFYNKNLNFHKLACQSAGSEGKQFSSGNLKTGVIYRFHKLHL